MPTRNKKKNTLIVQMCLHLKCIHRMPLHFKYAINMPKQKCKCTILYISLLFLFIFILAATGRRLQIVLRIISNLKSTEIEREIDNTSTSYLALYSHFVIIGTLN